MKLSIAHDNVQAEENGIWADVKGTDLRICVRSVNSDHVLRASSRSMVRHGDALRARPEDAEPLGEDELIERTNVRIAYHIESLDASISDVEGFTDDDGSPLAWAAIRPDVMSTDPEKSRMYKSLRAKFEKTVLETQTKFAPVWTDDEGKGLSER